jgi:MscS family membrane protein
MATATATADEIWRGMVTPLSGQGPLSLLWSQWVGILVLAVCAVVVGLVFGRLTQRILLLVVTRTKAQWNDAIPGKLAGPLKAAWTIGALYVGLAWLDLPAAAAEFAGVLARGGFFFVFFWSLARIVDIAGQVVATSTWAQQHSALCALIPLGTRVARIVIWAMGVVALLSVLGYPVASLVAGLGIGGLALALGAQKTLENLFGAFAIGGDQPFREGDFVKIDDFVGTVEAIGLRSTKIRTLDRTLVSIPNGKLADMRVESFTARDRIRLACTIGLVYGTTGTQMRAVLTGIEGALRDHPKIWSDAVVVRFKELAESSLNIEVMAWFLTADWSEFQLIRQETLLKFMEVVERAGTSFAFPTRTVHVVSAVHT